MAKAATRNRLKSHAHKGILQVLKEEHDRIRALLTEAVDRPESSEETFAVIYSNLGAHMSGEEQFFYPELEAEESMREQVLEAYEEHNLGKILLNELEGMSSGDERWLAKLKVLGDVVGHHLEEEENGIFPKARKILTKDREFDIARQYLEEKPDLEEMPDVGGAEEEEEL